MSLEGKKHTIKYRLQDLWHCLYRHIWQILFAALVCGSIAFGAGKALLVPEYSSTTRVAVVHHAKLNALTNSDLLISTQLKDYYADVVTSRYVVDQVLVKFGKEIPYEQFIEKIAISQKVEGSRIIHITVTDREPYLAKLMADELRELSKIRIEELLGIDTVEINTVEEGNFPVKPSNTTLGLWTLAGVGIGGVLATVVVIFAYAQQDTIRTPEDVQRYLQLSTLGMVPLLEKQEDAQGREQLINSYAYTEAFHVIKNNVEFCGKDIRVIAITSCIPNEGKSSVSYELANTFAKTGQRVVLIDADLRKSVLVGRHSKGKVPYGLTHYLIGKKTFAEVCYPTDLDNFQIVYAGVVPPNPCELLGNQQFDSLLEQVRREYDIVLIDTPPIGSVIDGAVVAQKCDGVILVLSAGEISYPFAQRVKEQIEKAGSRMLGCILNKADKL